MVVFGAYSSWSAEPGLEDENYFCAKPPFLCAFVLLILQWGKVYERKSLIRGRKNILFLQFLKMSVFPIRWVLAPLLICIVLCTCFVGFSCIVCISACLCCITDRKSLEWETLRSWIQTTSDINSLQYTCHQWCHRRKLDLLYFLHSEFLHRANLIWLW